MKTELKEWAYVLCLGVSSILSFILFPIIVFLEIPRIREEKAMNNALSKQFALDCRLDKIIGIIYAHDFKVSNGYWPTPEEFTIYGKAKKERDFIYQEINKAQHKFKEHYEKEKEYTRKVEMITLEYFFKKVFNRA